MDKQPSSVGWRLNQLVFKFFINAFKLLQRGFDRLRRS